jgi:hypothetical protein
MKCPWVIAKIVLLKLYSNRGYFSCASKDHTIMRVCASANLCVNTLYGWYRWEWQSADIISCQHSYYFAETN